MIGMLRLDSLVFLLLMAAAWGFAPPTKCLGYQTLLPNTILYANTQDTVVEQNFTATFPSCRELMMLGPGDHVASPIFHVTSSEGIIQDFRVLVYPRGGGHSAKRNKKEKGGFGMSYKVLSFLDKRDEKVGVYLQYLNSNEKDTVDATFTLLLKGQQADSPRFDVEWSSGMRFCSPQQQNLREGMANDFGAHLMQTKLLPVFLGSPETPLDVQVSIVIHSSNTEEESVTSSDGIVEGLLKLGDIRYVENGEHNAERVRVGKIVVPVLQRLQQRPRMFELGAYPGVEYRIMRIFHPTSGQQVFASVPGADYELKPVYPLVATLERPWPVRVKEEEIPKLLTAGMYNGISAVGSLLTAVGGLTLAFLVSQAISIFFIPSRSMDPTFEPGDALVVEKVTPRILGIHRNVGDVVLFSPPTRLRDIVSANGGRITDRDLFVKRIAAGPGDTVSVDASGAVQVNGESTLERRDLCGAEPLGLIKRYIQPGSTTVQQGQVFVLGDCSSVSIDSRVWGPLTSNEIVGRPLFRIWPLDRFGPVPSLPTRSETDWTN